MKSPSELNVYLLESLLQTVEIKQDNLLLPRRIVDRKDTKVQKHKLVQGEIFAERRNFGSSKH